jgi:Uncharacterised nucleotidyltransferase
MDRTAPNAVGWVHAQVLRQAVVDAAAALERTGVELMVVKGAYLVHVLGIDPAARPMLDVDAIVVRGSFDEATHSLTASGDWVAYEGWSSKTLAQTGDRRGVLDLHRTALPLFFGRIRLSALRRRGNRHHAFDGRVLVPDPCDAACLAVAHYVKDCLGAKGHGGLARDLGWIAERTGMAPADLASRLNEHGLRRIGIVGLTALGPNARWAPWLDALTPTRKERATAVRIVKALRALAPRHPDVAFLVVRSLGDRPATSACGFAATAAKLARDQLQRARRRFSGT